MQKTKLDTKALRRSFVCSNFLGTMGMPSNVESDGEKITRIRPFDYSAVGDKEREPWKIEARGQSFEPPLRTLISSYHLSYKKRVYSSNRVMYPLKRVDWDPKGDRHPETRGKSKYVRISWDEAAQIVADELVRVKEKYGSEAILAEADMHGEGKTIAPPHGCMNRLLSLLGGQTMQVRNEDSWEGWFWGAKNVWGCEPVGEMMPSSNLMEDIAQNTDMLLFWGCDPEVTPLGMDSMMATRLCYWFTDLGIKSVYIDPALNYGAAVHADKWIPILPNTDAALQLAIIYMWLTEGTYEKEYVETHAVGYEAFFDYVLGKEDGIPKTPKWASEKCGVPVWTIKALARQWAKLTSSIAHGNGGPMVRGPFSSEVGRLEVILLSMRGLGKTGVHQVKMIEWNMFTKYGPVPTRGKAPVGIPIRAQLLQPAQLEDQELEKWLREVVDGQAADFHGTMDTGHRPKQAIPRCLIHEAILNKEPIKWYGLYTFNGPAREQWTQFQFPARGCSRVHMIWTDAPCQVTCWNDGFRFVEAMRDPEIECVVAQHPWLENDCYMADIIFPVVTKFEMDDIMADTGTSGVFESVYRTRQACAKQGESLNDFDVVARVAEKLGPEYYNAYTYGGKDDEQIIEEAYQNSPASAFDENDSFHKHDIFIADIDPEIKDTPPGLGSFAEDPENNPLLTPTGKLEFTSTEILKHFPDDQERPPYPKWVESSPDHDERLGGERAKTYPLLCMSNHGRWRMHAQLDDITWHREVETMKIRAKDGYQYEPVWLNPETAAERGIQHRDIVKVFNERGIVLCGAYVTERLKAGVAYVDHGSRFDPIDPLGIDRGGAINLITPKAITSEHCTGMVVSGFLVDVQKVTDEEMEEWKQKYPEAFARKLDKASGVCLDGWLISNEGENNG